MLAPGAEREVGDVVLLNLLVGRRSRVSEDFCWSSLFADLLLELNLIEVLILNLADLTLQRSYGYAWDLTMITPLIPAS